jgi:chemotaxis protein CheD
MANLSVSMGQIVIGKKEDILLASGIGSCVVICLYSKEEQVGGAAHIMLPQHPTPKKIMSIEVGNNEELLKLELGRYADTGIDTLVTELTKQNINMKDIEAKIIGGAEMFSAIVAEENRIGPANILAVKNKLTSINIKVVSEDVGGNSGRSIRFSIENGKIDIKKRM